MRRALGFPWPSLSFGDKLASTTFFLATMMFYALSDKAGHPVCYRAAVQSPWLGNPGHCSCQNSHAGTLVSLYWVECSASWGGVQALEPPVFSI
ncbi:hypothetical protein PUN28_017964 [Cardiocondyla obscurior]|uniref:Uncharacterized protein n=1 Tax=Cardiocondyla obscurior TaxID=286306 RepID=A0AAW2EL55_9HYME